MNETIAGQFNVQLPDCLPILAYGLFSRKRDDARRAQAKRAAQENKITAHACGDGHGCDLHLPALLAKTLLAFAIEFELKSELSLALCANVMRVLDENGVRLRDLPRLSGVSKEAISMAMTLLKRTPYIAIAPDPTSSRTQLVRLTSEGRETQKTYLERLVIVEECWQERFAKDTTRNLRESLERIAGDGTARQSPLFRGLEPHPDGWRASVRKPETLPHYPMVSHRGGYPDGS